jgi:RNA polymerase sigma-70 factor (ECF subfamily)
MLLMSLADPTWSERSRRLDSLLSRVALGDRQAFAALYEDTHSYLFGVILRITVDRGLAEDVLQEVFVSVWRAAQGFDGQRSQPLTWLTSVARHRAIDSLRRRKAEPATVSLHPVDDDGEGGGGPGVLDAVSDPGAGPLQRLEEAADAHAITQCMAQLSRQQQQCLALAYYQGLSHAEAAQHLALPLGTVKSWVRRALLVVKDCLTRAGLAQGRA